MFIFIFLLFVVFLNHGMNAPLSLGKRKGAQLECSPKVTRNIYEQPSLEEMPDDITKIILMYVLSANSNEPGQKINFTVKGFHACTWVNKKLYRLTSHALKDLYRVLSTQHPDHLLQAVNDASITPKRIPFLKRLIESVPDIVFNLTPRNTPLMVAVRYNNENAVRILLECAQQNQVLIPFVNLKSGYKKKPELGAPEFEKPRLPCYNAFHFTALHIAANDRLNISFEILKMLLDAKASQDLTDGKNATVLGWAIGENPKSEAKVTLLMEYGADPNLGSTDFHGTPYERVTGVLTRKNEIPNYELFYQLFSLHKTKLK